MTINMENHPCFSDDARHTFGRVHLPVAPKCNIQCNFCNRKFDCVNESRPGVTSAILSPYQAMAYLEEVMKEVENISVVGIAGPGDPFANAERTMETLTLVREKYPDMILCVATNGLNLTPYVDDLARLQVSHVTVTINAVDPEVGSKVYSWVRAGKRVRRPAEGAKILLENQLQAVQALKEKGVTVKVNTIIMPGINDHHIEAVAEKMADLDVDILNCMSYYPTPGSAFENLKPPSPKMVFDVRKKAAAHIPQMHHCTRCRADAVGLLGSDSSPDLMRKLQQARTLPRHKPISLQQKKQESPSLDRPYIAATSMEGVLVNQHLGEASHILIYERQNGRVRFVEARRTPPPGSGMKRWHQLAELIDDCHTLLVNGIGSNPRKLLAQNGVQVRVIEGVIEEAAAAIFEGRSLNHLLKREPTVCGTACSGVGIGCG